MNSVVAKWLGLPKPILSGRSATRGLAEYPSGHGLGPEILQFIGQGFRSGVLPCSDTSVYWNYTWYPSPSGTNHSLPYLAPCSNACYHDKFDLEKSAH